ncbi:hypothetical protein NHE_0816 [Neorickettsia helminthoeca str. Oregon]|uniref:Uncharacterized protein n=1 Tax=Neorickettsia helminthoeca str. Oregon TaxID=1286528 RepID=X5H4V6_9RICK|nr:hypothetical protein NHE_0816 [Neorickettsia helminthoeca str. Oregon]
MSPMAIDSSFVSDVIGHHFESCLYLFIAHKLFRVKSF